MLQHRIGVFSRLSEDDLSFTTYVLNFMVHGKHRLSTFACCHQVKVDVISSVLQRSISIMSGLLNRILHLKDGFGALSGKCLGSGKD